MPHNKSQWVTHRVEGGWATDYGTTFYGSPQGGVLPIPWCKTCDNIKFNPDGSFGKYPGLTPLNPSPIKAPKSSTGFTESSIVRQIYDYVRMGSSLTGTRKQVTVVGSWLYNVTPSGSTLIGDLHADATLTHHMTTFNDLLIIAGGTAKSWDQTTFQSLAGTPPIFLFSTHHAGRHWAAGATATPSRLYYSAVGNPEDWVGAGSGSIDIDPGDGDSIVGILSWKRELWVFKGPHRLSIHRITGSSPSDFARVPFIYGVGAAGQSSIFPVGDDFAFWSPRGSCHSLTTTSNYGDYTQGYLNFPILSWCRNPNNLRTGTSSYTWQTVTDTTQNISYCVFNNTIGDIISATYPSVVFMMDWRFKTESNPYPRFIPLALGRRVTAVGLTAGIVDSAQLVPTVGDSVGQILQEWPDHVRQFSNNGELLISRLETPSLTYGPTVDTKTITAVSVDIVDNFTTGTNTYGTLDFSYGGRGAPSQTISFSNVGAVGLGTFVLGTDQLGGGNDIPNYTEAVNGDSRAFTYTFVEDTPLVFGAGTDVRVKHFSTLITPTGENLENT